MRASATDYITLIPEAPTLVNFGEWDAEITYKQTETMQPYVYQTKNGKRQVYMLVAKESLGEDPFIDNSQGGGKIWRRQEMLDLVVARKITANDIDVDNLVVRKLKSKETGPRVEIEGSLIKIFGESLLPNIISGVDENGYAVLTYYANNGEKLYDLGPKGLTNIDFAAYKWTEYRWVKFAEDVNRENLTWSDFNKIMRGNTLVSQAPTFLTYYAGGSPLVTPEERAREEFTYKNKNFAKIDDGWYFDPPRVNLKDFPNVYSDNTGRRIKPGGDSAIYESAEGVVDRDTIYYTTVYRYKAGKQIERTEFYWQDS